MNIRATLIRAFTRKKEVKSFDKNELKAMGPGRKPGRPKKAVKNGK